MPGDIEHDEAGQRFVMVVEGEEALVAYRMPDENTIDLYRTYVPEVARGRGVAGLLARRALEHARAAGLRVVPTCSYIAGFVDKHPEYSELVRE